MMMIIIIIVMIMMMMMMMIAGGREAGDQVPWPSCGCREQLPRWLSTGGCSDPSNNWCEVLFMNHFIG